MAKVTYTATCPFTGNTVTIDTKREIGFAVFTKTRSDAVVFRFAKTRAAAERVWGKNPDAYMPHNRLIVKAKAA